MRQPLRVLILEDQPSDARLTISELRQAGFEPQWERVETEQDFLARLDSAWDLILSDYSMPQFDALQALRLKRERMVDIPFIIVSGTIGEDIAVAAIKEGAVDYILKDRMGRLGQAVTQALEQRQLQQAQRRAEETLCERTQHIMLTADVGLAVNTNDPLRAMLQNCAQFLVHHLDAAFARIWTLNAEQNVLELQASAGMYTHIDGPHGRVPVGAFKIGLIAQECAPHLTNDVLNDPRVGDREWAQREGLIAFAGYPLIVEGRIVGVMAMFARHRLTQSVLDAMAAVANQIATGVERRFAQENQRKLAAERDDLLRQLQVQIARMPLAYVLCDADFRIIDWNPAAERMFGYRKDEVLEMGSPFAKFVPAAFVPQGEELLRRIRLGDMAAHSVNENLTKDGRIITCEWINTPLASEDGQFNGLMSLAQDVSERKRLEDQFRQAQKMEAVGKLAGGVAHDFNNLLTIILGYSAIVQESLREGDPLRESVEEIRKAGNRAAGLTRQLLAFSRKQVLVPVILDLNALLADMEKMFGRLIGEDIELAFRPADNLWRVRVDAGQMEQVVMNLVVNSRDAMPQGGKLTIETANVELDESYAATHADARAGEYALLAVSDTGCGMDRATLGRVFEPFFSTKGEMGTGLGLATVYGIVKQSGGHIAAYSEPQCGTTFKVYLPRDPEGISAVPVPADSKPSIRGTETVLLVEDEDGVRSLGRVALQRRGYKVLEARNGGEALLICEQTLGPIHLLATDVVMPNMSGRQLAERLIPLRPTMKVLYMSGYMDDAIVRHGLLNAEGPFLQKPYTPDALAHKVREVLDRPGAPS